MTNTSFFSRGAGLTLSELAARCEGELRCDPGRESDRVTGVATLALAGPADAAFFDNPRYAAEFAETRAACVIVSERLAKTAPLGVPLVVAGNPGLGFALAGRLLYPAALAPEAMTAESGISDKAAVDPSARIEDGAIVEAFATVGPGAEIGRGTIVASGAVVGPGCRIGRDCRIGARSVVQHALIGNRVILHPNVSIGQDGFGYAAGPSGILKLVQVGRVIVQDDVEIGSGTTVDRGAVRDTVIGENTKIDNQVQIAHNVRIGRNCLIVSQVGISGSATIEDGVAIGGQSGVNGHLTVGAGAQIAAVSSVAGDVPPRARWGGTPAHDVREWIRELAWLRESAKAGRKAGKANGRRDDDA